MMTSSLLVRQFFQLLRIAISDQQEDISLFQKNVDWKSMSILAQKQSLLGITFVGIQKLPPEIMPDEITIMSWYGYTNIIISRNQKLTECCIEIQNQLKKQGLGNCILKGQGLSYYYGELSKYRQAGDIDIWIDEAYPKIISWLKQNYELGHCDYLHTPVTFRDGVELEVHFRPWISRNIFRDYKLQQLARHYGKNSFVQIDNNNLTVLEPTFNVVHILYHIYWHLLIEGVGLRQLLDLYFVLLNTPNKPALDTIEWLGIKKFTSASMWILGNVFGMQRENMLCDPNEKEGKFLLEEILTAGNFGHYDDRIKKVIIGNKLDKIFMWIRHTFRLIKHYPIDVIWTPLGILYISLMGKIIRMRYKLV